MSIRLKLIGAFAFSSLLMLILGSFALWQLAAISRSADSLANQALPAVETTADIQDTLVAYRLAQNRLTGQAIGQRNMEELRAQETRMDILITRLRSLEPDAATLAALTTVSTQWNEFSRRVNVELMATSINRDTLDVLENDYNTLRTNGAALRQASRSKATIARTEVVNAYDTARSVTIAILAVALMFGAVVGFSMALDLADDLRSLTNATERISAGDLRHPITVEGEDELGQLADAFRHMISTLSQKEVEVATQQTQLIARADEIAQAYNELQVILQEREALNATVRALATPFIPIQAGVLIAPLVGIFDTERVNLFTQMLLAQIQRTATHTVIVDVTGMALIDQAVAKQLVETATAARLLGARTILVGIRPEIAQTLIGLDLNLEGVITQADLQRGVAYALATIGQLGRRAV